MSSSKPVKKAPEPVEWDLSESFGILPEGLSLTHNLGCVRTTTSASKKETPSAKNTEAKGKS